MIDAVHYFLVRYVPVLLLFLVAIIIPATLTIWNICNLIKKDPKSEKPVSSVTLFLGGIFYMAVHGVSHAKYDDWIGGTDPDDLMYSVSSEYRLAILIPVLLGGIALLVLLYSDERKILPAISALCIALVILMNVIGIFYAVQFSSRVANGNYFIFLYVYHLNVLLVSVIAIRGHTKQQKVKLAAIALSLVIAVAVLETVFALTGKGIDAPVKAFTDTTGWTLSR